MVCFLFAFSIGGCVHIITPTTLEASQQPQGPLDNLGISLTLSWSAEDLPEQTQNVLGVLSSSKPWSLIDVVGNIFGLFWFVFSCDSRDFSGFCSIVIEEMKVERSLEGVDL